MSARRGPIHNDLISFSDEVIDCPLDVRKGGTELLIGFFVALKTITVLEPGTKVMIDEIGREHFILGQRSLKVTTDDVLVGLFERHARISFRCVTVLLGSRVAQDAKDNMLVKNGMIFVLSNWTLYPLTGHQFILWPAERIVLSLFAEEQSPPPSPLLSCYW
jgi:hypothetical protein